MNIDIYFFAILISLFNKTCFGLCGEIPGSTGDKLVKSYYLYKL